MSPQRGESHAAVASLPTIEGVLREAVVAAVLGDRLLVHFGLSEYLDDPGLAETALTHRIRSLAGADTTISGGPDFGGQVTFDLRRTARGDGQPRGAGRREGEERSVVVATAV
jgi:hypothetical protein